MTRTRAAIALTAAPAASADAARLAATSRSRSLRFDRLGLARRWRRLALGFGNSDRRRSFSLADGLTDVTHDGLEMVRQR